MSNRKILSGCVNTDKMVFAAAPGVNVNEGHSLIVDGFESVLYDYLKRDFPIGLTVNAMEASGPIHIFNEQKKLPSNTKAIDYKLGEGSTTPDFETTISDTDYGRNNWVNASPRLYGNRIEYDYFSMKMEQRYGSFEDLTAKDYDDMIVDFTKVTHNDFWNGRSTGLIDSSSANKFEYHGILNQITDSTAITSGTIADNLNTKMSSLMARLDYAGYPDIVCMNAATYDILVQEELARGFNVRNVEAEIVPGWKVPGFNTYVGTLPIMLTPFIKPTTNAGTTTHKIVCLNRKLIDKVWWINNGPQFFEFANPAQPLGNQRLLTNKQMLEWATYILRAPQTGSHFTLTKGITA